MATYYWVGGSGTWNATETANWSTTSGGAGGAGPPTLSDNVFFNGSSGSGFVVTVSGSRASCANLDALGVTFSIIGNDTSSQTRRTLRIAGNVSLSSGTTLGNGVSDNNTGALLVELNGGTCQWTSTSATINADISLDNATLSLQDTFTGTAQSRLAIISVPATVTLNSWAFFIGGFGPLNPITLNFGTGKIVTWALTRSASLPNASTVTGTNRLIEVYAPTSGDSIQVGSFFNEGTDAEINTAYNAGITVSVIANPSGVYGGELVVSGGVVNLTIGNFAITVRFFVGFVCGNISLLGSNPTFTYTTTPEYVNAINWIASTTMSSAGTVRTITSNGGTFGLMNIPAQAGSGFPNGQSGGVWRCADNVNAEIFRLYQGTLDLNGRTLTAETFTSNLNDGVAYARTIQFNGGAIKVTSSFDTSSPTNLTLTGTPSIQMAIPNSGSTVSFNSGSLTTYNVSTVSNLTGGTASLTGSVNNLTLANIVHTVNGSFSIYGDFTASGNNVTSASGTWTFAATSGTKTINANNATFNNAWTFNGVGGTWQLNSALNIGSASTMTLTNGTINFNSQDVSIGTFSSSNTNGRTLTIGDSTVNITGSGTSWNTATSSNLTVNYGAAARISMNSASAKTFAGGGKTWPTVNQGGAGTLSVTGNNTFTNFTNTVTGCTISFPSGTTTFTAFSIRGVFGSPITLSSTSTLSKASGTVAVNYLNLSNSTATGGAQWYAGAGSTDGGGNTGWIFSTASTGGFLAFF